MKEIITKCVIQGYRTLFESEGVTEFAQSIPEMWGDIKQVFTGMTAEQRDARKKRLNAEKQQESDFERRKRESEEELKNKEKTLNEKYSHLNDKLKNKYSDKLTASGNKIQEMTNKIKQLELEKNKIASDYEKKLKSSKFSEYQIAPINEEEKINSLKDKIKILEEQMKIASDIDSGDDDQVSFMKSDISEELNNAKKDLLSTIRSQDQPLSADNIHSKLSSADYDIKVTMDRQLLNKERAIVSKDPSINPIDARQKAFDSVRLAQIKKDVEGNNPDYTKDQVNKAAKAILSKEKNNKHSIINVIIGDDITHKTNLKKDRLIAIGKQLSKENPHIDIASDAFADMVENTYYQYVESWALED